MSDMKRFIDFMFYSQILIGIFVIIATGISTGSFEYLTAIPIGWADSRINFPLFRDLTINYWLMLAIIVGVYLVVIGAGTSFLGSGLSTESIATLRKISSIFLIFMIATMPYYSLWLGNIEIFIVRSFFTLIYWLSLVLKIGVEFSENSGGSE